MRVLSIIHLYPPHHLGGYEVACQGAMDRFCANGHEVLVLTAAWRAEGVEEVPTPPGMEIRRELQGWWDWSTWSPSRPRLTERVRTERVNQRALSRALDEFRPDVASVWSLGMTSWALATRLEQAGVPTVFTFLDDWVTFAFTFDAWTRMFDRRPWARPLGRALGLVTGLETRLPTFAGARASVASHTIARAIEDNGRWKFPAAPVIPIGVDTRDFPLGESPERPFGWRLLYAGRVVREKGVPTLIEAMGELPHARLDVVGPAGERELRAMQELAHRIGVTDRVCFSRAASRPGLRRRYVEADLVVFPSEWAEPFGIVPLEAMACGVPVIATGTGGSGEYLADERNCLLFRPGEAADLARAARRVAADDALRARIVAGGSDTARTLTMDRFAERLEHLHDEHRRQGAGHRPGNGLRSHRRGAGPRPPFPTATSSVGGKALAPAVPPAIG